MRGARGLHAPRTSHLARPALLLLVLLAVAAPLAAQQPAPDREIAESQRRLEQIRRERAELRAEMERIRSRVHDLSSELSNLQLQVSTSASALEELEFQLEQRSQQVANNTRELISAQDVLAERKALLNRRLRDVYKRGPLHATEVMLSARSFSDLLNRYKYLYLVARRDRALVDDVQRLEHQLTSRERALRRSLDDLRRTQQEREAEHAQLAQLEEGRRRALSSARGQERTTAERIARLAADERRLSGAIAELERRRREAERLAAERRRSGAASGAAAAPAAGTMTTADLGNLAWPVQGRVVYRFGRTPQPNGTTIRWNGIGIGAPAGTPVRAVEAGTVVMAGPFEGYGPTVVLSHGGGYYSLYLYLREVQVEEGAEVARGQTVGTVGGESTPEGAHIEFQIRAPGGGAVDPLAWLQKQGTR